jgi:hypothetical protein
VSPEGSRDWQLLTYQILVDHFENQPIPEGPSHQEEPGLKHPEQSRSSRKDIQQGEATFITTQPRIPTLRRDRDPEKAPVKSVSTWIRNQRKGPRTLAELRGNPFLS